MIKFKDFEMGWLFSTSWIGTVEACVLNITSFVHCGQRSELTEEECGPQEGRHEPWIAQS